MQVKENVNASNFLLVGNHAGNEKGTSKMNKDTDALDFASILTQSKSDSAEGYSSKEKSQGIFREESVLTQTASTDKAVTREESVKQPDKASMDDKKPEAVNTSNDMSEDTKEISEEEMEEAYKAAGDVLQMVMKQFGLSFEELTDRLNAFGMEISDLMTAGGLKDFFLSMNSADVSNLITDEKLNQELQAFIDQFNQILQENHCEAADVVDFMLNTYGKDNSFDLSDFEEAIAGNVNKETAELVAEPEVIISQSKDGGAEESAFSKEENTSGQMQMNPSDELKQTVAKGKESFQNPILQAINDAVNQISEASVTEQQSVKGMDIIEQIVEQVRVSMNQDTTSMELQLYPEHLGRIQIHVVSKDGVMTARIAAETEAAKQAIENGLTNLKDAMQQQNLKVDAIEVMVSTTGFERGSEEQAAYQHNNAKGSGKKLDLSELDEENSIEEEAELEKMRASGSSVSYMA